MTTNDIIAYVEENFTEKQFVTMFNYIECNLPSSVTGAVVFERIDEFLDNIPHYKGPDNLMTSIYEKSKLNDAIRNITDAGLYVDGYHKEINQWFYLAYLNPEEDTRTVDIMAPSMDYRISVFAQYIDETLDISKYDDELKLISDFIRFISKNNR